jgi:hypothetical protein
MTEQKASLDKFDVDKDNDNDIKEVVNAALTATYGNAKVFEEVKDKDGNPTGQYVPTVDKLKPSNIQQEEDAAANKANQDAENNWKSELEAANKKAEEKGQTLNSGGAGGTNEAGKGP